MSINLIVTSTHSSSLLQGKHSQAVDELQIVDDMHGTADYRCIND